MSNLEVNPSGKDAPQNTAAHPRVAGGQHKTIAWLLHSREASVVVVLLLFCLAMTMTSQHDKFFGQANIQNVLRMTAMLSIIAIGETIVIITGGIDLSLGSSIAFSGMLVSFAAVAFSSKLQEFPALVAAVCVTLVVAFFIGFIHANLIHKLRLPPFVVTLAALLLLRSQARMMNGRKQITLEAFQSFSYLANGTMFKDTPIAVPIPVVILFVIGLIVSFALNKMRIGRYIYSVGSNEQATMLSGVSVFRVKLFAYGASALLAGLAGILWASYGGQGDPTAGEGFELEAVAASVVGGANLSGGQGSVAGTVCGSLLLYVIFSAINLSLSAPDIWRGTVVGGVLLFAVLVTAIQQKRRA